MAAKLEYLLFVQMRDWSKDEWPVASWVLRPGETEWAPHDSDRATSILQELGDEGWELVGPPVQFTAILPVSAQNVSGMEITVDGADWYRREFWLKRVVS